MQLKPALVVLAAVLTPALAIEKTGTVRATFGNFLRQCFGHGQESSSFAVVSEKYWNTFANDAGGSDPYYLCSKNLTVTYNGQTTTAQIGGYCDAAECPDQSSDILLTIDKYAAIAGAGDNVLPSQLEGATWDLV